MYLNQKRAEPGDTITLTIEANEPLDYLEDTDVLMSDTGDNARQGSRTPLHDDADDDHDIMTKTTTIRAVHHGPRTQHRSNRTEYRID